MSSAAATAADEAGAPALDRPQPGYYRLKVGSADVVALPHTTRAVGLRPFFNNVGRAAVGKIYDRSFGDVNDGKPAEQAKGTAMSSANSRATPALRWEVFVTPGLPIVTRDKPAGVRDTFFQAMAATLIYGERDAVLVDAFMTVAQANALADWVAARHKNLTTIHITHGHGDHWFGVATLLERFPHAKAIGTPSAVKVMRQNASPARLDGAWKPAFPGQIPDRLVVPEELKGNVIDLEGHQLVAVELGHTDTEYTTCLSVPSIGLVVAGDAAYNDVHLYLAESNAQTRREWIAALDKMEALNPRFVVASHKRPENADDPRILGETRQYIQDFDRLAETTTTAQELYDRMLELHPNRVNPGWALWSSARAVKP